jgi:hypothetical protein
MANRINIEEGLIKGFDDGDTIWYSKNRDAVRSGTGPFNVKDIAPLYTKYLTVKNDGRDDFSDDNINSDCQLLSPNGENQRYYHDICEGDLIITPIGGVHRIIGNTVDHFSYVGSVPSEDLKEIAAKSASTPTVSTSTEYPLIIAHAQQVNAGTHA